jgi:hypothetical protein
VNGLLLSRSIVSYPTVMSHYYVTGTYVVYQCIPVLYNVKAENLKLDKFVIVIERPTDEETDVLNRSLLNLFMVP